MPRRSPLLYFLVIITFNLLSCATSNRLSAIYQPEKFELIIASESDVLDAAYEALLELYPYTLFLPLLTQQPGFYWRTDAFDFKANNQFEIRFEESLGMTKDGSIILGYRYSILSYGNEYINDLTNLHDLDIVFRDELFKRHIERIEVEEVL